MTEFDEADLFACVLLCLVYLAAYDKLANKKLVKEIREYMYFLSLVDWNKIHVSGVS